MLRILLLLCCLSVAFAEDSILDEGGSILGEDFLETPADEKSTDIQIAPSIKDKQTLQFKLVAYNQSDDGGIEEVDEDASIFEAVIVYTNKITDDDTVSFSLLGDVVSAASIERTHNSNYRSLQSGASGTTYVNAKASYQRQVDNWKYKANAAFGKEYAYESQNLGFGVIGELNDKNTTVSANVQMFADSVRMIRFNGVDESDEDRDTLTLELGVTQILTPKSLLNLSLHHSTQSGFLATQFNSVFVSGTEDFEILPEDRDRTSLTARYKYAFDRNKSYEVGLRYYTDDWDIDGQTLDLKYFQYINDRSNLMEFNYRFYLQNESKYYQEDFTTAQEFQTSDPDLGDFTGHMFGIKSTFKDKVIMGQNGEWDVGAYYYTRDNGLDMMWIMTGFKLKL